MNGKELRIGMVNHFMPELGVKHGGVVQLAHDLAQGMSQRGHKVIVWTYSSRPAGALYETKPLPAAGFVKSWLGARLTFGLLGNFFFFLPKYKNLDALLLHGDTALLGLKRRNLVRVMHGSALGEAFTARNPFRFFVQLIVYLQELFSAWMQPNTIGVSRNSTRYNPFVRKWISNGVDTAQFRTDSSSRSSVPSILFVGTLGGRKRGGWLLDQFKEQVLPKFPDAVLNLVTETGPEVSGVRYHTGITKEALASLYRECWVYASPSLYEGFGLPYLEAMASGTSVLATPNPGSIEVTGGGEYGLLADDMEFVPKLIDLLSREDLRCEMVNKGLKRAEELSLERMLDQYESLFRNIAEGITE